MTILLPLAFAVSLMMSPDTLVIWGRLLGGSGSSGLIFLITAAVFFAGLLPHFKTTPDLIPLLARNKSIVRPLAATAITSDFWIRFISSVFMATGLMVSAGFAFNEIFVYWFPNFGFAFLLLAALTAVQWFPKRYAMIFQGVACGIVLAGFIVLIGAGIVNTGGLNVPPALDTIRMSGLFSMGVASSLLIFVGIDLGMAAQENKDVSGKIAFTGMGVAIALTAVLYFLWGRILLALPLGDRLAHSSIPHILGAKAVLGETGRMIIGIMIIAGACAAVNGLFFSLRRQVSDLMDTHLLPAGIRRPFYMVFGASLISGGLMAAGFAGHPELETVIKACLAIWLFSYSLKSLLSAATRDAIFLKTRGLVWFAAAGGASIAIAATDENRGAMTVFWVTVLVVILSTAALLVYRNKSNT